MREEIIYRDLEKITVYCLLNRKGILMAKESAFQKGLINDLKKRFPGCMVLKNDPNYIQGIPDLLVLYEGRWAALECKKAKQASHQPNQDYYVERMNEMSFSRFVYPENKENVLDELQQSFQSCRPARFSRGE
jgi:hypothetical protein|nr:MAG TPA: Nuclease [Caudoviricetes sp.]